MFGSQLSSCLQGLWSLYLLSLSHSLSLSIKSISLSSLSIKSLSLSFFDTLSHTLSLSIALSSTSRVYTMWFLGSKNPTTISRFPTRKMTILRCVASLVRAHTHTLSRFLSRFSLSEAINDNISEKATFWIQQSNPVKYYMKVKRWDWCFFAQKTSMILVSVNGPVQAPERTFPPDPKNHVNIFKGLPRRFALWGLKTTRLNRQMMSTTTTTMSTTTSMLAEGANSS